VAEAMQAARCHGVIVSYDLNYRASLWKAIGGKKQAQAVNRRLAPMVDVMLGNEEDFSAALGVETFENVIREFPFQVVATSLREAATASRNDWGAICYADGVFHQAKQRRDLEIFDRVGGGDSFASGLI
jgi:2-dehydro-3-deoxygluconokinase